jgi:two-component system CheB/CheR fusion protein
METEQIGLTRSKILSRSGAAPVTDLDKIVEDVINDFDLVIFENNVQIQVSDLPEVEAVAEQMRQVFYSLISNSIKFNRPDTMLSNCHRGRH